LRKKRNRDHTHELTATKIYPGERKLQITRYREVLVKFPNPVAIIMTSWDAKYRLICELAKHKAIAVNLL
jgi:hypothetical protein